MNLLPGLWSANRSTIVRFPLQPTRVTLKEHNNQSSDISLRDFVTRRCPSLFSQFYPAWWLSNGHLQTLYCVLGDFSKRDAVVYKRTYIRLRDGGTLGLDFVATENSTIQSDTPIIVVMHGLTGGSYESYVRAILAPACSSVQQGGLGYRAVVINFRGCAGVPITSPQLYSAGHTDDLRQALFYISHRYPKAPLLGLSFSLGANVMTRYVAEEANTTKLLSTYIGRHIYSQGMGRNLVNLLKRHVASLAQNAEHPVAKAAIATVKLDKPTVDSFDESFTRIAGGSSPPWPFDSAYDYYEYASSHKVLGDVRIPFLAINAADDPVVQDVPMDASGNEWIVMALTPNGGHLGWFEADEGWGQVRRWIRQPVMEWLRATGEDLVSTHDHRPLYEIDGFLTEAESEKLGCKEIDGGGLIIGTQGQSGMLAGL